MVMNGMIEFFPPILENFCPLFILIAQMGLISPRWGLILPRIPPPTPVLYLAVTHPFWRYVPSQNTINPPKNSPFPVLNLKVGKMNYNMGNLHPNWAKRLKSEQNSKNTPFPPKNTPFPLLNLKVGKMNVGKKKLFM